MHFGLKIRENAIEHFAAWIEYDAPPATQGRQLKARGLAHPAANAVSPDSVAKGFGRGETETALFTITSFSVSKTKSGE